MCQCACVRASAKERVFLYVYVQLKKMISSGCYALICFDNHLQLFGEANARKINVTFQSLKILLHTLKCLLAN